MKKREGWWDRERVSERNSERKRVGERGRENV